MIIDTFNKVKALAKEGYIFGDYSLLVDGEEVILKKGAVVLCKGDITTPSLHDFFREDFFINLTGNSLILKAVDFLYNYYNKERIYFKRTGKVKQKYQEELNHRAYLFRNFPYTDILLNRIKEKEPSSLSSVFSGFSFIRGTISRVNGNIETIPANWYLEKFGYKFYNSIDQYWDGEEVEYQGQVYPKEWFDSHCHTCSVCGETTLEQIDSKGRCSMCIDVDESNIVIRSYQERATRYFKYKIGKYNKLLYKEPLLFGIELEYESQNVEKGLREAGEMLSKHCIFKRDSSIENGFEIVTAPATLDIHSKVFKKFFSDFPEHLHPASSCGMHVHVSRKPLNFLTQGKLVEFMNREENKSFLAKLAGRWSDEYAGNDISRTVTFPWNMKESEARRYNALNTNNKDTLEFRIFSSPNTWEDFIKKMEFCDALVAYCSPCQSRAPSLKDVTKKEYFFQYVADNKKQYPNLFKSL